MLIAHLNVKFLLTKEGKRARGGLVQPRTEAEGYKLRSPARVGGAWPRRGVATEASASCSGEHVVPCLPPRFSVTVCWKVRSFSRLVGFIFISPPPPPRHPTAQQTSSPLPLHPHFHFRLRRCPGLPTARPRSLQRIGEGQIERV